MYDEVAGLWPSLGVEDESIPQMFGQRRVPLPRRRPAIEQRAMSSCEIIPTPYASYSASAVEEADVRLPIAEGPPESTSSAGGPALRSVG